MPRRRRYIISNSCYEVCFRAKNSLPFVCYKLISFLLACILARAQRDDKVIICHDIWNGSHPHLILVAKDSQQFINFIAEVEKKITDVMKRLLGLDYLSIWEDRPMIARLADQQAVKNRIAYLYANPANDNLEDSIERFPGYSSWQGFSRSMTSLSAKTEEFFPWIRLPSVPKLLSPVLNSSQDTNYVKMLKNSNKKYKHQLVRQPNAWMSCFGITEDREVADTNAEIVTDLRAREQEARELRLEEGKKVLGRTELMRQPILKEHQPKKKSVKIFVICTIKELRQRIIQEFKDFCDACSDCYQAAKAGDYSVRWPPGAFRPPLPPLVNVLAA